MGKTSVLAIPGSLRKDSYNRALLRTAEHLTPSHIELIVYDRLDAVPVFNEDFENPAPEGVTMLREAVASTDGLLIATPEYNQSVPGVVKNMLDWLSRSEGRSALAGKPVAVIGASTGPWGTRIAQTHLRQMLLSTQALVLPQPTLFVRDAEIAFDEEQEAHGEMCHRLEQVLLAFDAWIRMVQPEPARLGV
jgi:chromate reductase